VDGQGRRKKEKGKNLMRRAYFFLFPFSFVLSSGCAGLWDDVTSRDFTVKGLFVKPEPMVVLKESADGDKRARALHALREPKENGGTDADQDAVVKVLTTAASSERQPLCRLAAIQSLAGFKDPRAVEGLKEAFYNASSFPADTAVVIRCQALAALGETGNAAAIELLARVVREPPSEGSEIEKQQTLDVRTAAARALANFPQRESTEVLVRVMQTEKDVALRDRAHESLEVATGKKLPADAKEWNDLAAPKDDKDLAGDPGKRRKVLGLF
jgi:HEAT repeat protein